MAADKLKGVVLKGQTYYVRTVIPVDVRSAFGGKGELWETLGTGNPHDAVKMAPPIREKFKRMISDARAGCSPGGTSIDDARRALAARKASWQAPAAGLMMPVDQAQWVARMEDAASSVDGWKAIPGFDELVAKVISSSRVVDPAEPVVASMRQEVAAHLVEQERLTPPSKAAQAVLSAARQAREGTAPKALPAPSIRLRKLFDQWMLKKQVSDKEVGRLEHQIRRLIEFAGDKPANHLTKQEVEEFMDLVARFPGRKRSAALNALPMVKLVESFEKDVAAVTERNAAKKEGEPLEEVPSTLKASTVDEWFTAYRQMFNYGKDMELFDRNPFEGRIKMHVVKGAPSTKKREFTAEEIAQIFSAPLFNGFSGDGSRGYRNMPGTTLIRDAKYWLPILALFHGGRLSEFAAMPHADLKQDSAGHWYFDLTNRQVKNKASQRYIPLHPEVEKLGFLEYVAELRRRNSPWLFPDLDHDTKHGPGHSFSKWWGNWMDARGMTDKSITHHSWRHTFKRAARQSPVKEEMHDVLTGHKRAAVSRGYGEGADIGPLVRDMALIAFPTFPNLPVTQTGP